MIRPPALHLASTSPRRREILAALQLEFSVGHVDVDETPQVGEAPADMALRLARAKAEAGNAGTHDLVLAADTVVVVDGHSLGKPADEQDCLAMLDALSGRSHKVLTGVALRGPDGISTGEPDFVTPTRSIVAPDFFKNRTIFTCPHEVASIIAETFL